MERAFQRFITLSILVLLTLPSEIFGDVVLTPSADRRGYRDDGFPESRFGAGPADPTRGVLEEGEAAVIGGRSLASITAGTPTQTDEVKRSSRLVPNPNVGIQQVALIADEKGFFPSTIFVTQGIPVRIFLTGASEKPLCFMADSFNLRKQVKLKEVEEITFTPQVTGQYSFYCPVNQARGTIVVNEVPELKRR